MEKINGLNEQIEDLQAQIIELKKKAEGQGSFSNDLSRKLDDKQAQL